MLDLHPQILKKDGKKQFVVLPYHEFLAIQDRLEDANDLLELRQARRKEAKSATLSLSAAKRRLGLKK